MTSSFLHTARQVNHLQINSLGCFGNVENLISDCEGPIGFFWNLMDLLHKNKLDTHVICIHITSAKQKEKKSHFTHCMRVDLSVSDTTELWQHQTSWSTGPYQELVVIP